MPDDKPRPHEASRSGSCPGVGAMKALAHPLRLRMYRLLQEEGAKTSAQLARIVNESSGVTSYHLRQLERRGLVEEDTSLGTARERWWFAREVAPAEQAEVANPPRDESAGGDGARQISAALRPEANSSGEIASVLVSQSITGISARAGEDLLTVPHRITFVMGQEYTAEDVQAKDDYGAIPLSVPIDPVAVGGA